MQGIGGAARRIELESPYFEDLSPGQVFGDVPAVTLGEGHAALHAALTGDRLRLPLDAHLARAVTGRDALLAHPNLVCNVAIGQSTPPSGRVLGNLFYRGLLLQRPVFLGDTLYTSTRVVALRQNRMRPGRAATGMAVLEVHVENQAGETVLHFWRCPMLPCRDPGADTGRADSFDAIPAELELDRIHRCVPADWDLDAFRRAVPGAHFKDVETGVVFALGSRDTITGAPELARLTLNLAAAHTDAGASHYGRRLVYGGHTISLASAQLLRALPNLVTLLGWRSCDHTAPVFEGDRLRSEVGVEAAHPRSEGGLLDLHVRVFATRGCEAPEPGEDVLVLDWRVVALMA